MNNQVLEIYQNKHGQCAEGFCVFTQRKAFPHVELNTPLEENCETTSQWDPWNDSHLHTDATVESAPIHVEW